MRRWVNKFSFSSYTIWFYCYQSLFIHSIESARARHNYAVTFSHSICIITVVISHCVLYSHSHGRPLPALTKETFFLYEPISMRGLWYVTQILYRQGFFILYHQWYQRSLCQRYTHPDTHACCKYRCWCLCLVAGLKLAHICSCIDPPALCANCVCVCLCTGHNAYLVISLMLRGEGFPQIVHCHPAPHDTVHAYVCWCPCICVSDRVCVCVWMEFIPVGPDAPAKSITSGAAQLC